MGALKKAWKKLQFKLAANEAFGLHPDIRRTMEKDGWTFKDHFVTAASMTPVGGVVTLPEKTPDGKNILGKGNESHYVRYEKARLEAAKKVFKIK